MSKINRNVIFSKSTNPTPRYRRGLGYKGRALGYREVLGYKGRYAKGGWRNCASMTTNLKKHRRASRVGLVRSAGSGRVGRIRHVESGGAHGSDLAPSVSASRV